MNVLAKEEDLSSKGFDDKEFEANCR